MIDPSIDIAETSEHGLKLTILVFKLLPNCIWNRMPPLFWGSLIPKWNLCLNNYVKISSSNSSWGNIFLSNHGVMCLQHWVTKLSANCLSLALNCGSPSHRFFPLTEPLFPVRNLFYVDSSGPRLKMSKFVLGLYDWFKIEHVTQSWVIGKIRILVRTFLLLRNMLPFP